MKNSLVDVLMLQIGLATGEITRKFTSNEIVLIRAVVDQLKPQYRLSVEKQLLRRLTVQRYLWIADIGFDEHFTPDFAPAGPDDEDLYRVRLEADGERSFGNVVFYGGQIIRIETRIKSKHFRKKTIKVLEVKQRNPKLSSAYAMDRLEHGKHNDLWA